MQEIYDPTQLGLQVAKKMGDEVLVFCPFHSDSNPSAEYNMEKGVFFCFGCHESRSAKQLAKELGGKLVPVDFAPGERGLIGKDLDWVKLLRNPLALDNEYLMSRQVENWQVESYSIRANRDGIIFPIYNILFDVIGIQMRHYHLKPKYLFYGSKTPVWPMLNLTVGGPIFITEGIFGVLRSESVGLGVNAVAMMGASQVENIVELMKTNGMLQPYALMDPDWAGLLAAGKFILMGIPAILKQTTLAPDDWQRADWADVADNYNDLACHDVMEVIDKSEDPYRMQQILEKFYRRL